MRCCDSFLVTDEAESGKQANRSTYNLPKAASIIFVRTKLTWEHFFMESSLDFCFLSRRDE
jgi:hypothetical protein